MTTIVPLVDDAVLARRGLEEDMIMPSGSIGMMEMAEAVRQMSIFKSFRNHITFTARGSMLGFAEMPMLLEGGVDDSEEDETPLLP